MPTVNLVLQALPNVISSRVQKSKKKATSGKSTGFLFLRCLLCQQAICKLARAQLRCVRFFFFVLH